jgi:hypothetical protein
METCSEFVAILGDARSANASGLLRITAELVAPFASRPASGER